MLIIIFFILLSVLFLASYHRLLIIIFFILLSVFIPCQLPPTAHYYILYFTQCFYSLPVTTDCSLLYYLFYSVFLFLASYHRLLIIILFILLSVLFLASYPRLLIIILFILLSVFIPCQLPQTAHYYIIYFAQCFIPC